MTAIAPASNRTAVVVAVAVVVIAVGALVVAHVVPQKALIATAMMVFLLTGVVSRRFDELGLLAVAACTAGLGWSFGLWCSFRDFPLLPGLAGAGVVVAATVVAARSWQGDPVVVHGRLLAAQTVMLVLMVLSWGRFKSGVLGVGVGLLFVGWGAVNLFAQVALAASDNDDNARTVRAAAILRAGADVCWNALVTWARLLPDDDSSDGADLFG